MSKKEFFLTAFLSFFLFLLFIPASLPVEGGIILLIVGVAVLVFQLFTQSEFYVSKAFLVFVALLGYLLFWQFYSSKNIPITYIIFHRALLYFLFLVFLYTFLQNTPFQKVLENSLIIIALLVSFVSLREISNWYLNLFEVRNSLQYVMLPKKAYRLSGFGFGHPNPLAGFLNFVWPLIFVRFHHSRSKKERIAWLLSLVPLGITFLYTNSRSALLGTFSAILLLAIFLVAFQLKHLNVKSVLQNKKVRSSIFIAGGVLFLFVFGMLWRSIYTGQFYARSFSGRGTIWLYSWQAFMESPILGQGPGAFPTAYARLAQLPPGDFAPSAHNIFLQLSVDYGIMGFIFMSFLVVSFFFCALKALRHQRGEKLEAEVAYIAAGVAFLAQQQVDYMLVTANYLVFSLVILALLLKHVVAVGEWKITKRQYAIAMILLIVGMALSQNFVAGKVMSFSEYMKGSHLYDLQEWEALENLECTMVQEHVDNAIYKFDCSNTIVNALVNETNKQVHDEMLERAFFYQQAGTESNPYWATQKANLATLYWKKGDKEKALSVMRDAVDAAPFSDILLLNLAWMEESLGYEDAALANYTRALRLNPLLNLSEAASHSNLLPLAAQDLGVWLDTDNLWHDWYQLQRHDRNPTDYEYWKGVIALSTRQYDLAVKHFENSMKAGSRNANLHIYLAYAYKQLGENKIAESIVHDFLLLSRSGVGYGNQKEPITLWMAGSLLREYGYEDDAYDFFLAWAESERNRVFHTRYYPAVYMYGNIGSELSPLLIRSYTQLNESDEDWLWFVEQANLLGDVELANKLSSWHASLSGIAIE